jgi:hypothetical protein
MKSTMRALTSLAIAVLSITASANAQSPHMTLKFTAPFEFSVGSHTYPAGDYFLVSTGPHTLALRDGDYKLISMIDVDSIESLNMRATPTIRFAGERHALAEVWQSDSTTGYRIHMSGEPKTAVTKAPQTGKQVAVESQTAVTHTR